MLEDVCPSFVTTGRFRALAVKAPRVCNDVAPRCCLSRCCGDYGRLNHGEQADEPRPRVVTALTGTDRVASVAATSQCTLFLTDRGHACHVDRNQSVGDAVVRPDPTGGAQQQRPRSERRRRQATDHQDVEDEEAIVSLSVVEQEDVENFEQETLLAAATNANYYQTLERLITACRLGRLLIMKW